MVIEIRPIKTEEEYRAVEQLQREIWGAQDIEIVAHEMLMTAHKNGGVMLGAFDREILIGFVFGFVGLTPEGRIKHCSHMAGVAADYRDQNVGYALKLKQREQALAHPVDLVLLEQVVVPADRLEDRLRVQLRVQQDPRVPPGGEIRLSVEHTGDDVVVRVADHGPGVPIEDRERIFEAFYRGASIPDSPGTGLGLAIANAIVKAHDGRVWVEDTPGGGATFAFEIPVRDRDVHDLPLEPVVEGDRA